MSNVTEKKHTDFDLILFGIMWSVASGVACWTMAFDMVTSKTDTPAKAKAHYQYMLAKENSRHEVAIKGESQ